jgi:hypothetical protein
MIPLSGLALQKIQFVVILISSKEKLSQQNFMLLLN